MHKNQLQELAQRSCFNLPSYTCIREGPDHAPRFKAAVNFNGETFESPSYCFTIRQAEHSAAEVALNALSCRGPSNSLASRILDETGVYKNLLQEVSQRVGASLPVYTTFRTGLGHFPVFTCTVELASVIFAGEQAKNKKQAEKNAAMAAWLSLKSLVQQSESSLPKKNQKDEQEHVIVSRALEKYIIKARMERKCFPIKFPVLIPSPNSPQQSASTTSKILPLICPKLSPHIRNVTPISISPVFQKTVQNQPVSTVASESLSSLMGSLMVQPNKFPAAGTVPYIPPRHCNPHHRIAPPVTIRNSVPVFSAPPRPSSHTSGVTRSPVLGMVPPVRARQVAPLVSSTPMRREEMPNIHPPLKVEDQRFSQHSTSQIEQLPLSKITASVVSSTPMRRDEMQNIHLPLRVEDQRFSRHSTSQIEQPPLSKTVSGRLEEFPFFKPPLFRVEESRGPKLLPVCLPPFSEVPEVSAGRPTFEVTLAQARTPVSVASSSPTSSNAPARQTRNAVQDMLQESAVIKDLKAEATIWNRFQK